jgi:hypothetical protein
MKERGEMARDYRLTAGKPWRERKFVSEICFVTFSVVCSLQTGSNNAITVTYGVPYNILSLHRN